VIWAAACVLGVALAVTMAVSLARSAARAGLDPVGRRLAEDLVKAMPQAELEGVFLALPVLDGLVRREIHTRNSARPT
jgi:hypothetical protein